MHKMAETRNDGGSSAPSAGPTRGAQTESDVDLRTVSRRRRYQLAINDPDPVGELSAIWRGFSQLATVGIFVLLLIAALELGRPLLLPTVSAVVIGMILGPLSSRALRYGVPTIVSAIVLWLLVVAVFYGIVVLLSAPVVEWVGKGPEIARNVREKLHVLDRPMAALDDLRNAVFPSSNNESDVKINFLTVLQPALTFVTPAIGQLIVFFGVLFFFLLGRLQLRHVLVVFFDSRTSRLRMLRILNDVEHNLTSYLSVVTVINLGVGLCAGVIAYLVGLPNPVAWAVLAFLLNFLPYIGALIMELVLFLVGLVTFPTLSHAVIAPLIYLALSTLEGHFITPAIMGNRLTLNPLTVFLALVFWSWLWGPIGTFLAVPLLIIGLVAIHHLFPKPEAALPG